GNKRKNVHRRLIELDVISGPARPRAACSCAGTSSGNMSMRIMHASLSSRRRVACVLMVSALSWGCAGSPPRAAPPPGIPPNVTLVATPIALLASADAAPLPGPAASSEPAPPPAEALAPLPTPSAPTPGPPATANVLMSDELPFFPVRLRAHDADRRRAAHDRDATHEAHDRDATHEAHEAHEAHEGRGARKRPYHPAPGIIVDVTDAQGGATAADLQRIARNAGYWPFGECYEEGLRGDQRLSGKVSLELVVNPSGGIDRSTITA